MLTLEHLNLIEDARKKRKLYIDAKRNLKEFEEYKKAEKLLLVASHILLEFKEYQQGQRDLFDLLKEELTDNERHLIELELDNAFL